ncbi:jg5273 [Pararge aegeria aegeria]|uniref:Jg5273 protein n=1 Tax=Pararge aegeria aegeria TaxID=348720 RepID=A0A8S4R7H2_9NEOP|nr:jg5273 [Pararge aegeria aegeria]
MLARADNFERWNGNPEPINAALVDPQPDGQTTSNESTGAAGYKRPRIVAFGTLYKIPMFSSERKSVDLMKMMMMRADDKDQGIAE